MSEKDGKMDAPTVIAFERWRAPDGSMQSAVHGPSCERTKQLVDAIRTGKAPPPPGSSQAAPCGPPRVTSDAYRSGWDAINWSGKKPVVGQA